MINDVKYWQKVAEEEKIRREQSEKALEEMRHFLFDYFYLLGPDPKKNMSIVVSTLGKVLGSAVALYNRMEAGSLKTWCIDNEPDGYQREDSPDGHICYDMTIRQNNHVSNLKAVKINNLEGTKWEKLDSNVSQYGLKSYLGFPVTLEDRVVGSLCVVDTKERNFSELEVYIIQAFASAIRLEEERLLTQEKLALAVVDLKEKNKKIEQLALTDSLTELPNRRALMLCFNKEIADFRRKTFDSPDQGGKGFSIAICDIDNFKTINDTYGHNCGDYVLQNIAKILEKGIRPQDSIGRWGGEEFLLLFPNTDVTTVANIIERLRQDIAQFSFTFEEHSFQVTMTFGTSTLDDINITIDSCVSVADAALYFGKKNGKNQVVASEETNEV
ncbi:MAG: sensor domain-containing diguanylate cyclase [Desulforegulaceae bacterium]|nr:sensor domain-containing diguanylate cyclase [Desulforegulaceae bacterium]